MQNNGKEMYKKKCAARAKLLFWLIRPIVVFDTHYVWTACIYTGNPGSVIVPQYGSSKITVFVWGKNTIPKFVGNAKYKTMKLTLQLVVVVLIAPTKFRDNLFKFTLYTVLVYKVGDKRCHLRRYALI